MIRASALAIVLAACGGPKPPGHAIGNEGGGTCVERELGHENAEAVSVAVGDGVVAWQGYNFGELKVRALDGDAAVRTLVKFDLEHHTEDLLVYAGHAYWSSKAEHGLFRVPLAGGPAERLIDTGENPATHLARVGDTIFVRTFDKVVYWWSPTGGAKSIVTSQAEPSLTGRDGQLYLGREFDIATSVDLVKDPPHQVAATGGRVSDVAVTASMLYWSELADNGDGLLLRQGRSGGEATRIEIPSGVLYALHATDQGVFVSVGEQVLWFDDRATTPADVMLFPPGEYATDIDALGESVFIGTSNGNVLQSCFSPPVPGPAPAPSGT